MDKRHRISCPGEKLVTCPFNIAHRVSVNRMPAHLVACRKNYPDADVKTCPFNAIHVVTSAVFKDHIARCPNLTSVEREVFIQMEMERLLGNPQPTVQTPQVQQVYNFENEEDWDSEMVESSYNPEASIVFKEFTRPPPPGLLGKSKRKEWRAKEVERVERLQKGESIDDMYFDAVIGAYGLNPPDKGLNPRDAEKAKPSNDLMTDTRPLRRPSAESLALSSRMAEKLSISDNKRKVAQDPSSEKLSGAEKGHLENQTFGSVVGECAQVMDEATKALIKKKRKLEKKLDQIAKLERQSNSRQLDLKEKEKVASKKDTIANLDILYDMLKVAGVCVSYVLPK